MARRLVGTPGSGSLQTEELLFVLFELLFDGWSFGVWVGIGVPDISSVTVGVGVVEVQFSCSSQVWVGVGCIVGVLVTGVAVGCGVVMVVGVGELIIVGVGELIIVGVRVGVGVDVGVGELIIVGVRVGVGVDTHALNISILALFIFLPGFGLKLFKDPLLYR